MVRRCWYDQGADGKAAMAKIERADDSGLLSLSLMSQSQPTCQKILKFFFLVQAPRSFRNPDYACVQSDHVLLLCRIEFALTLQRPFSSQLCSHPNAIRK